MMAYGYYFWRVASAAAHGGAATFAYVPLLYRAMAALGAIEIVSQIALALASSKEAQAKRDEREKLIALKATSPAFRVLLIGSATGAMLVAFGAPAFYSVNLLFLSVVLAQVLQYAGQVFYFRVGA